MDRHPTATGIVIDGKGHAALLWHKKLDTWLPPGGHVERGETPCQAVIREIREETGLEARILPNGEDQTAGDGRAAVLPNPWYVLLEDIGPGHQHVDFIYLCAAQGPVTASLESKSGGWFGVEEIGAMDMYLNTRRILERALKIEL